MARTSLTFSFPKAYFREGSRVPTFVLPGIIRGNIHIARRYEESFDIVKIVLKGKLQTGITLGVSSNGLVQMRSLQRTFLELVDTRAIIRASDDDGEGELAIPFKFIVPNSAIEEQARGLPGYPPSLSVGKQYLQGAGSNIRAHGLVQYQIEVYLCTRDRVVCSRQADIDVLNGVMNVPPPIPLDDFPDDYICATSRRLCGGKIRTWFAQITVPKPRLRLAVETDEPQVLCLHPVPQNKRSESIDLEVRFQLSQLFETVENASTQPGDLHITMTWSLKTTTFVAVVPMEEMPTRAETAANPYVTRTSTYTPAHTAKTILRGWRPVTFQHQEPETAGDEHGHVHQVPQAPAPTDYEARWNTRQNFHLAVADTIDCLTTFSTPYISRRNTLQLQLECFGWGATTAHFKLEVPIQIAMRIDAVGNNGASLPFAPRNSSYFIDGVELEAQADHSASPLYVR